MCQIAAKSRQISRRIACMMMLSFIGARISLCSFPPKSKAIFRKMRFLIQFRRRRKALALLRSGGVALSNIPLNLFLPNTRKKGKDKPRGADRGEGGVRSLADSWVTWNCVLTRNTSVFQLAFLRHPHGEQGLGLIVLKLFLRNTIEV